LKYAGLLYTLRRNEKAQAQATEAVRLAPGSAEAHHILGNVLEQKGLSADSLREYREAVRLDPKDTRSQLDLGAVLVQSGDRVQGAVHLRLASVSADDNVRRIAQQMLAEVEKH
jgi:Flp pilus assembly protein TadD